MNRAQIERAEKVAWKLQQHRREKLAKREAEKRAFEAVVEAQQWERANSLATTVRVKKVPPNYEFTDAQLTIAMRSLG